MFLPKPGVGVFTPYLQVDSDTSELITENRHSTPGTLIRLSGNAPVYRTGRPRLPVSASTVHRRGACDGQNRGRGWWFPGASERLAHGAVLRSATASFISHSQGLLPLTGTAPHCLPFTENTAPHHPVHRHRSPPSAVHRRETWVAEKSRRSLFVSRIQRRDRDEWPVYSRKMLKSSILCGRCPAVGSGASLIAMLDADPTARTSLDRGSRRHRDFENAWQKISIAPETRVTFPATSFRAE